MIENIDGYGLLKVTKIELIKMIRSAFEFGLIMSKEIVEAVLGLCGDGSHPAYIANKVLVVSRLINDGSVKLVDGVLRYETYMKFLNEDGDFVFTSDEIWDIISGTTEMKREDHRISMSKKFDISKL